jgi:uncharacterized membrane protein YuzA (DUF378 family)
MIVGATIQPKARPNVMRFQRRDIRLISCCDSFEPEFNVGRLPEVRRIGGASERERLLVPNLWIIAAALRGLESWRMDTYIIIKRLPCDCDADAALNGCPVAVLSTKRAKRWAIKPGEWRFSSNPTLARVFSEVGARSAGRRNRMRIFNMITLPLVVIGALNWGLVGLFQFDLVAALFGGQGGSVARIIYVVVGAAGVYQILPFWNALRTGVENPQLAERHTR